MTSLSAHVVVSRTDGLVVDAAFTIEAGTTVAMVGPNGAGKSTIVAALAGLLPIEDGFIRLGDSTLDDPGASVFVTPANRHLGVVFQGGLLFPHLSVRDNVSFGLANGRRESGADKVAVDQWLDRLGLLFLADRKPRDLSGGEAQRVALARALATQPSCLILDEPMGALDVSARGLVRSMVADHLSTFEGPTLVITHDPAEAFLLADTIIVLEGGVVSQQGTASDLQMHPASSYVADVVGTNLVEGTARGGIVDVAGHQLVVADVDLSGSVLVSFHPRAVSLHTNRPVGSQRNAWATTVRQIDDLGHTCRIRTGDPLALIAEVTTSAVESLGLIVGSDIWVAIKATELAVASSGDPA